MPNQNNLTRAEINNVCKRAVEYSYSYSPEIFTCFETMYTIGCREGEVCDLSRWQLNPNNTAILITLKRGGTRTFVTSDLPQSLIAAIQNYGNHPFVKSSRRLRSYFNQVSIVGKIWCKEKEISCHLFRHNRVKQLHIEGKSFQWIADYLTVSSEEVAKYYNDSIIYTKS